LVLGAKRDAAADGQRDWTLHLIYEDSRALVYLSVAPFSAVNRIVGLIMIIMSLLVSEGDGWGPSQRAARPEAGNSFNKVVFKWVILGFLT
jgi:hypothetical protein